MSRKEFMMMINGVPEWQYRILGRGKDDYEKTNEKLNQVPEQAITAPIDEVKHNNSPKNNLRVKIVDRVTLEKRAKQPFDPHTAIISVDESVELENKPDYILQISDVDIKRPMIIRGQAEKIAEFIIMILDKKVEILICQCVDGQMFSIGVAAAVKQFSEHDDTETFMERYNPPKDIYVKILRSLHNPQKGEKN